MLLVSYPDIRDERTLPVYVSSIGIEYPQETLFCRRTGEAQLLFSVEGTGVITIDGREYELPEGSGIYLNGRTGYQFRPRGDWKISWVTFGTGTAGGADMLFLGRDWCTFDLRRREEIPKTLREIYDAVTLNAAYGACRASALLYGLLVELNGILCGVSRRTAPQNPAMESILAYIDENYTRDITLDQLCTAAGGLSEQYLCRLFKQTTGMRPMEYMLRRRISAARTYLERTDLPISDVALRSGFHNTSYFYRNFRKFVGLSPLAYRQSVLGVESVDKI